MEHDFWEHGNSVKVNFGEHLNLFLRNKGATVNLYWKQGNMHPPSPPPPFPGRPSSVDGIITLVIDLIGQLRRVVIGRLSEE